MECGCTPWIYSPNCHLFNNSPEITYWLFILLNARPWWDDAKAGPMNTRSTRGQIGGAQRAKECSLSPQLHSSDVQPWPGLCSVGRGPGEERENILFFAFLVVFPPVLPPDICWKAVWWRWSHRHLTYLLIITNLTTSLTSPQAVTHRRGTIALKSKTTAQRAATGNPDSERQEAGVHSSVFLGTRVGLMKQYFYSKLRKHLLPPAKNKVPFSTLSIFTQNLLFCRQLEYGNFDQCECRFDQMFTCNP